MMRRRAGWLAILVLAIGIAWFVMNPGHRGRFASGTASNKGGSVDTRINVPPAELVAAAADKQSILSDVDAARAANAKLPLVADGVEPSVPFRGPVTEMDRTRAETCLAQAIYYEAGFEGEAGRRAVAQVVLNRLRHPAFPHTVCDVVFQRSGTTCQFTFACDGSLSRRPIEEAWQRSLADARAALGGHVEKAVGMATHYHADYVYPAWATQLDKIAVIGRHIFYRWPYGWGRRRAFIAAYAGVEPGEAMVVPLAPSESPTPIPSSTSSGEVAPRRSDNDGGYVDPAKGWRPSISQVESEAAAGTGSPPPH